MNVVSRRIDMMPADSALTLSFRTCGRVDTVTWGEGEHGVLADCGRRSRDSADMVTDPAVSALPDAITRTHRLLAALPGCTVATAATDACCVASWRADGHWVDVMVDAPVDVAAAFVYARLTAGDLVADRLSAVCVERSGVTRRFVVCAVPLCR